MAGGKRSKKDLKRKGDTESPAPGGHNEESMEVMGREEDWVPEAASKNVEDIPDAEEDETSCEDDEETACGEAEAEEAPAGGQPGGERNNSQSPLLAEISLTEAETLTETS